MFPASGLLTLNRLEHVISCLRTLHMKRSEIYQQCFRVLGVHESADQNTVRQAYLELVKRVHPDAGTAEASQERFQQVDEAFKILQEKFAKNRRNIQENEEEPIEFDIKHTAPQHRQYLDNDGIGLGTPYQRQKQYQQVRAMKAQQNVLEHRIQKASAVKEDAAIMCKKSGAGGNYFGKHAIKTKYGIDRMVEDLIQEAMSKGDFNNLSGAGKPLSSTQSQNPYLDFTTHKLNKIMLDNGFTPTWITLNRDIRDAVDKLKKSLRAERIYYGEWPLDHCEQSDWCTFQEQHEEELLKINKLIDKYNLIVPVLENQFFRLHIEKLSQSIFQEPDLPRNVKRQPKITKKNENKTSQSNDFTSSLFTLINSFL